MYVPHAALDSIWMQGVYNCTMYTMRTAIHAKNKVGGGEQHQCNNNHEIVLCSAAHTSLQCLTLSVLFNFTASASPKAQL